MKFLFAEMGGCGGGGRGLLGTGAGGGSVLDDKLDGQGEMSRRRLDKTSQDSRLEKHTGVAKDGTLFQPGKCLEPSSEGE